MRGVGFIFGDGVGDGEGSEVGEYLGGVVGMLMGSSLVFRRGMACGLIYLFRITQDLLETELEAFFRRYSSDGIRLGSRRRLQSLRKLGN